MWKQLVLAAFIVIAVLVFIKLSFMRYRNKPVIPLSSRILISLLFPVVGLVIVFLGSILVIIILGFVVLFFLLLLLFFLLGKPKIYFIKKKF